MVAAALITAHAISHQARNDTSRRSRDQSAGTTQDWQYFKSRWNDYVRATRLLTRSFNCCDDQLRKDLTLSGKTEDEVLAGLAVREENAMVARVTMRQERDERARLRGQAKFVHKLIHGGDASSLQRVPKYRWTC